MSSLVKQWHRAALFLVTLTTLLLGVVITGDASTLDDLTRQLRSIHESDRPAVLKALFDRVDLKPKLRQDGGNPLRRVLVSALPPDPDALLSKLTSEFNRKPGAPLLADRAAPDLVAGYTPGHDARYLDKIAAIIGDIKKLEALTSQEAGRGAATLGDLSDREEPKVKVTSVGVSMDRGRAILTLEALSGVTLLYLCILAMSLNSQSDIAQLKDALSLLPLQTNPLSRCVGLLLICAPAGLGIFVSAQTCHSDPEGCSFRHPQSYVTAILLTTLTIRFAKEVLRMARSVAAEERRVITS